MQEFTHEYVEMFKRWSDFNGKSNVKDFWMAFLVNFLVGIVFTIVIRILPFLNFVQAIYGLVIIVPFVALTIRRLRDAGKNPWLALLWFIPVVGWIIVVYLLVQPSK